MSGGLGREDDGSQVDGGFVVLPGSEDVLSVRESDDIGLSRVIFGLSWIDGRRRRADEMGVSRSHRGKLGRVGRSSSFLSVNDER